MDGKKKKKKGSHGGHKRKSFEIKPNLEEIEELTEKKGLDPETLRKRKNIEENFEVFLETNNFKTLGQFCGPEEPIQEFQIALSAFFECYRVEKTNELPMKGYCDNMRSHLRMIVKEKTDNRIDICCKIKMKRFHVSA